MHLDMVQGRDKIWRPGKFEWYQLGTISPGFNQYVPQLDAMLVRIASGWSIFDWWFDRSGIYRVAGSGLEPIGTAAHRAGEYPFLNNLPSADPIHYRRSQLGEPDLDRLTVAGKFEPELRLAELGRFFNLHEAANLGLVYATTPNGTWLWNGADRPAKLGDLGWETPQPLPLTRELLVHSSQYNALVQPDGQTIRIAPNSRGGKIFQVEPDRWFDFGDSIKEVRLQRN